MSRARVLLAWGLIAMASTARAEVAEPQPRHDEQFDFMNELAALGLHDLEDERWNAYGQLTFINQWKSPFPAAYTNLGGSSNSLLPVHERGFTGTASIFLGLKLWDGGEIYAVPEMISSKALSGLKGLGSAIQNFELQKSGRQQPTIYMSRLFFKQTWNFGGAKTVLASDPMQLGATVDARRLVVRVGNFSVLDFFDKNAYSGDLRRQFNNMAFLTYAAYDFGADAKGYTWGAAFEYVHDDWSFKFAHIAVPIHPNQLPIDTRIFKHFGHQIEIERRYTLAGQPGAARILAYRNQAYMGRWDDAVAAYRAAPEKNAAACTEFHYDSTNSAAPDLCWARKPNVKMGIGINLEQQIFDDIGLFFRGMYSDGKTEVYSYTSTDRSVALGAIAKGARWNRPKDSLGIGYARAWLSESHVKYLAMGGIDAFIGDGAIRYRCENVVNLFYSLNLLSSVWLTADYQHIENPAYNAARGPVDIYGARIHAEF